MSMLHRQLLGQIMVAIDPILETGLTVFNPAVGAAATLLLKDGEKICNAPDAPDAPAPAPAEAPNPVSVGGKTINSPLPASPVDQQPAAAPTGTQQTDAPAQAAPAAQPVPTRTNAPPAAPAPAPAAPSSHKELSAQDVIDALMHTLLQLQAEA